MNFYVGGEMTRTGLDVFDSTLQVTYDWLQDLMERLDWDNKHHAYLAIRATLQALRDRLPVEAAANFAAQLPMLIRGFYYEGWKPAAVPIKIKNIEEFLEYVRSHFANTPLNYEEDLEPIVRAVFQVVANHISEGEVHHVKSTLPLSLASLWPSTMHIK